jgi:hypothetical protein
MWCVGCPVRGDDDLKDTRLQRIDLDLACLPQVITVNARLDPLRIGARISSS